MSHPVAAGLRSSDAQRRRAACRRAASDESGALWIEALVEALGDPVRSVAQAASEALAELGGHHPEVAGQLARALRDDLPERRWYAAFTCARLAPPELRLLPALIEALESPDGAVRWSATRLLVEAGRSHGEVLPVLLHLVEAAESPVARRMASHCVRRLAPGDPAAARALLAASGDPDVRVRRAALAACASLLEPPPETEAHLLGVATHRGDPACRRIALVALGALAARRCAALSETTRSALRELRDVAPDPDLRRAADRALAAAGPGRGGARD